MTIYQLACLVKQTMTTASVLVVAALAASPILCASNASAQDVLGNTVWAYRDPATAASANIRAQAALIRAQGAAAVDFATARNLHLQADSLALDVWMKKVRTYYAGKRERKEQQLELNKLDLVARKRRLNDQRSRNLLHWERLALHPELVGANIGNGVALNFVLQRLSAVGFEPPKDDDGRPISKETLNAIRFRLPGPRGERVVLSANRKSELGWPFELRGEAYRELRETFETQWKDLLNRPADRDWTPEELLALEQSLAKLAREFFRNNDPLEQARKGPADYFQMRAGKNFLLDMDRQIQRLKTVGNSAALRAAGQYDPARDGNTVASLLAFMMNHGIEFAPPQPGYEHVYHRLFAELREHYIAVADTDEGIQPADLPSQVK